MKIFIFCLLLGYVVSQDRCLYKQCECTSEAIADENLASNGDTSYIYDITCRYEDTQHAGKFPELDETFPLYHESFVYVFDLQSNKIASIPDEAFNGLSVSYLDLNLNEIRVIGNRSFAGLLGSVALDLSSNKIELIEENAFNHGELSLRSLRIENNMLGSMDPGRLNAVFSHVDSLTALLMGNNGLTQMPKIGHMSQLKQLSLSKNQIEHLGPIPSSVSDLDLDQNRIKSLDANTLSNLVHLKYLSLDGNQISHIDPDAFSNLVELVSLNLARNHIKHLPNKFIFNLIHLDRLDLSSQNQMLNNISAFAFDRKSNEKFLKSIDLSGNQMSEFSNRAFCSHNQSNSYINLMELSLPNKMKSEVNACWFVHLSRGYHSTIEDLNRRMPRVVFKKSTLFDHAEVYTKCSCEFEKARLFVNLDGHCLMEDGQLVPFSSYSCQGNFEKKQVEAECDSMSEYQCSVMTTSSAAPTTVVTSKIVVPPVQSTTTAPVEFVHEAEKPELATTHPVLVDKTHPVEQPQPVVEEKVNENKNDQSNTLPTKQTILNSSNNAVINKVLFFASVVLVTLL